MLGLDLVHFKLRQRELIPPLVSRLKPIIDIYAVTQFLFHYGKPQAVIKRRKSLDETQETNSCREKKRDCKKVFWLNFIFLEKPFSFETGRVKGREKKHFLFFLFGEICCWSLEKKPQQQSQQQQQL